VKLPSATTIPDKPDGDPVPLNSKSASYLAWAWHTDFHAADAGQEPEALTPLARSAASFRKNASARLAMALGHLTERHGHVNRPVAAAEDDCRVSSGL
jgi:hypothetical protein